MIVTFSGPSCRVTDLIPSHHNFGPAVCGSVMAAVRLGCTTIVLIDGAFGTIPTPWHKELLLALSQGVKVIGSSSIGALRSVELECFGMIGIGQVFELYKTGILEDDADVCVSHAPAEMEAMDYQPFTVPYASVFVTMTSLLNSNKVDWVSGTTSMKKLHRTPFHKRSIEAVDEVLKQYSIDPALFWADFIDIKRSDALAALTSATTPRLNSQAIGLGYLDLDVWSASFANRRQPPTDRLLVPRPIGR
jgi:hypothetical protein